MDINTRNTIYKSGIEKGMKMNTEKKEKVLEYVCDKLCLYRVAAQTEYQTQEERDAVMQEYCDHCELNKLMETL